jgi:hypothetical protein
MKWSRKVKGLIAALLIAGAGIWPASCRASPLLLVYGFYFYL